jgi:glycosyltransferase involved in cell wall biosynthesis
VAERIRVAVVASTLGVGGAERVTADVLRRLDPQRFQSELFFLHEAGVVGRELIAGGFVAIERLLDRSGEVAALLRLARLFRAWRPDVVFCLDHHDAMTLGRLAGLSCGARGMIVASHATGLVGRRGVFGPLDRLLMDFTGSVVAVSRTHARYLERNEGLPVSMVRVIENGIDLDAYPPVDDALRAAARAELDLGGGERVVLMVAAMRPEKAHEALLGAARQLRDDGVEITVLLAGDGERRAALQGMAQSLGIERQVRFLGVRGDVARLLHAADAVVLPSRGVVETLPLAVIEAMAVGVPVVASNVGSVGELVRDGASGFLIPPADEVALAGRLAHIFQHPGAAWEMGARGRENVRRRFGIERTARGYETLFEEMVRG